MRRRRNQRITQRARELRARQTAAESLLWGLLRGRRLCGLKFRRQFPIEHFVVDFACIQKTLVVEVDGGYHDHVYEYDMARDRRLRHLGWDVVRFSNEDVLVDVEAIAIAIGRQVKITPEV